MCAGQRQRTVLQEYRHKEIMMEVDGKSGETVNREKLTIYKRVSLLANLVMLIWKICYYICESVVQSIITVKKDSVVGEIVLITGAGQGIGKELAIGYASLGATVVCWDINEETNKQTMNEIKQMGKHSVYAYKCDVTNREDVFNVAEKVRKEVGNVTILINNAGMVFAKKLLDSSKHEIDQVIDVNFKSHYWTIQAFLPNMIEMNHGHIVANSSIAAFCLSTDGTVYCATKLGVKGLMQSMHNELCSCYDGKTGIKFTTVYPVLVLTGFVNKIKSKFPINPFIITTERAASSIIDAQRRNLTHTSIPSYLLFWLQILSILPDKAQHSILHFAGVTVE